MVDVNNREFNNIKLKEIRQRLRNNMTSPEIFLWQKIRGKQINGLKFRRQYSIDGFIVDFYCVKLNLAIEIDGDTHYTGNAVEKDQIRDELLKGRGINVLRFTNDEIMHNISGVLKVILAQHTTPSPS